MSIVTVQKCVFCEFYSTSHLELQSHNSVHFTIKYSCVVCPFSSTKKANLNQHILQTHSPKTEFTCTICKYVCRSQTNFDKHSARHAQQSTYICLVCHVRSKYRRNILRHVKKKHAELPLSPGSYIG